MQCEVQKFIKNRCNGKITSHWHIFLCRRQGGILLLNLRWQCYLMFDARSKFQDALTLNNGLPHRLVPPHRRYLLPCIIHRFNVILKQRNFRESWSRLYCYQAWKIELWMVVLKEALFNLNKKRSITKKFQLASESKLLWWFYFLYFKSSGYPVIVHVRPFSYSSTSNFSISVSIPRSTVGPIASNLWNQHCSISYNA